MHWLIQYCINLFGKIHQNEKDSCSRQLMWWYLKFQNFWEDDKSGHFMGIWSAQMNYQTLFVFLKKTVKMSAANFCFVLSVNSYFS